MKVALNLKCTPRQMLIVLSNNCETQPSPERNMILAIFGCALQDISKKQTRASAESFFTRKDFDLYCNLIGLNATAALESMVLAGFLCKK